MATIHTDRRTLPFEPAPEAHAVVVGERDAFLGAHFRLARAFAEIDEKRAYVAQCAASISEYGTRTGYDPQQALELCWLGKALKARPELEAEVRENRVRLSSACQLGRLLPKPQLIDPGEDWVLFARTMTLRALKRRIQERLEKERQRTPTVVPMTFLVAPKVAEDFDRCRIIASYVEKKELSHSETFCAIVESWLARMDITRQEDGTRRLPPTDQVPEERGIPAEVKRAIKRRSKGLCEVQGCRRVAVEYAHIRPHELGSGREVGDLFDACHTHHVLYDAGYLRFVRWTEDGHPVFADRDDRVLEPVPPEHRSEGEAGAQTSTPAEGEGSPGASRSGRRKVRAGAPPRRGRRPDASGRSPRAEGAPPQSPGPPAPAP